MKKIFRVTPILLALVMLLSSCTFVALREEGESEMSSQEDIYTDESSSTSSSSKDGIYETTFATDEASDATFATDEVTASPEECIYTPVVLMYHLIREETYGPYEGLFVRPDDFDRQLTILDELGYEYLYADEWRMTAKPSVVITLDDGYSDNYTEMLPILKKHNAKATVFVVTDLMDTAEYMTTEQVRAMAQSGCVSIQSHTAHHNSMKGRTEEVLRADFAEASEILESITGKKITALAYPAGDYDDTTLKVAGEFFNFAYTTDSPSTTTEYTDLNIPRYGISRNCSEATFRAFISY